MRKFTLLVLLPAILYACGNGELAKQKLIGSWRYDVQSILDTVRAHNPSETEWAMVEGVMTIYKDAIFDFQEDGTLIVVTNGIKQDGTWEMSADGRQLSINLSGPGKPNDVVELTADRLTLAPIPDMGLFYKRIFIPVEENPAQQ